jgi:hypothetical protein
MARFAGVLYPQKAVERAMLLTDQHRFGLAITNHASGTLLQGADRPLLVTTFRSERSYEKRHHQPPRLPTQGICRSRCMSGRRRRIRTYAGSSRRGPGASQTLRSPSAGFAERATLGTDRPIAMQQLQMSCRAFPWDTCGKSRPGLPASASGTPIANSSGEVRRCAMKPSSTESSRSLYLVSLSSGESHVETRAPSP